MNARNRMRRSRKIFVFGFLGALFFALVFVGCFLFSKFGDPAPRGEGSYAEAKQIRASLSELGSEQDADSLPRGIYRMDGDAEFHYYAMGTNSHGAGGGTIGLRFPDGEVRTFFGHVCGGGPIPLELQGSNKEEVLTSARSRWRENVSK